MKLLGSKSKIYLDMTPEEEEYAIKDNGHNQYTIAIDEVQDLPTAGTFFSSSDHFSKHVEKWSDIMQFHAAIKIDLEHSKVCIRLVTKEDPFSWVILDINKELEVDNIMDHWS